MLPDTDGFAICRALRADRANAGLPVIMLTARAEEADRVLGLELGADDYVVKPFSPKELAALPPSPALDSLQGIAEFVVNRQL